MKRINTEETAEIIKAELGVPKSDFPYDFEEEIWGPDKEIVPFELKCEITDKYDRLADSKYRQGVYVRVGDWFFIHDKFKERLKSMELANVVYLSNFDSALDHPLLVRYAGLTIYALDQLDLEGKTLVHLGSADSSTGLFARIKGASYVTAVDRDPANEQKLRRHVVANDLDWGHFRFIQSDVRFDGLGYSMPPETDIVMATLGPHYNGADMAAISLMSRMPSAKIFIGGGYTKPSNMSLSDAKFNASTAIEALTQYGFTKYRNVLQGINDGCPRLTFIAERT